MELRSSHSGVQIREADSGLFVARFVTVALRDGVLRSGIWHCDNAMVVVAKYDSLSNPTLVELNDIY